MNPGLSTYTGRCPFLQGAKEQGKLLSAFSALASGSALDSILDSSRPHTEDNQAVAPGFQPSQPHAHCSHDESSPSSTDLEPSRNTSTPSLVNTEVDTHGTNSPPSVTTELRDLCYATGAKDFDIGSAVHGITGNDEDLVSNFHYYPHASSSEMNPFSSLLQQDVDALSDYQLWQTDNLDELMLPAPIDNVPLSEQEVFGSLEWDFSPPSHTSTGVHQLNLIPFEFELCHQDVGHPAHIENNAQPHQAARQNKRSIDSLESDVDEPVVKRQRPSTMFPPSNESDGTKHIKCYPEVTRVGNDSSPDEPVKPTIGASKTIRACDRCKIAHKPCIMLPNQLCCERCSRAEKKSNADVVFCNDCTCYKLRNLSPFAKYAKAYPGDIKKIWQRLIQSPYFYENRHEAFRSTPVDLLASQFVAACSTDTPTHVHEATSTGHNCALMQSKAGVEFYYAILALLVPYTGSNYEPDKVIASAGVHAIRSLSKLMKLRSFQQATREQKCATLACLFYALIAFVRIRKQINMAQISGGVWFHEYQHFCAEDLEETIRVLAHYFLLVAERVELPLDHWYGNNGAKAKGFRYVQGICHFVRTFENEDDFALIAEVFGDSPLLERESAIARGQEFTSEA